MGAFVGIIFDGLAYGSLLFLISLGLSVTMGLMNFVNLAHGAFAMLGGFLCIELTRRLGMPFLFTLPVVFVAVGCRRGGAGAAALPAPLSPQPPRSGAVHDRLRVHGGRRRDLGVGAVAAAGGAAGRFCTGRSPCSGSISAPTGCFSSRWWSRSPPGWALFLAADAVRRAAARRGRQPASGSRRGRQRRPPVQRHVCARIRAGGAGRRAGHRRAGPGPDLRVQVPGLLPGGGGGRRRGLHQGLAGRGRPARRRRRGGQVLRPPDRQLHHLCRHGGAADRFSRGALWSPRASRHRRRPRRHPAPALASAGARVLGRCRSWPSS